MAITSEVDKKRLNESAEEVNAILKKYGFTELAAGLMKTKDDIIALSEEVDKFLHTVNNPAIPDMSGIDDCVEWLRGDAAELPIVSTKDWAKQIEAMKVYILSQQKKAHHEDISITKFLAMSSMYLKKLTDTGGRIVDEKYGYTIRVVSDLATVGLTDKNVTDCFRSSNLCGPRDYVREKFVKNKVIEITTNGKTTNYLIVSRTNRSKP